MEPNIFSQATNNNAQNSKELFENIGVDKEKDLHNVFSRELGELEKNGFTSKIDAYKDTVTGVTTVAIGLSQKDFGDEYVLVKNDWKDNKWNMNVIDGSKGNGATPHNLETSVWLASHGLSKSNPNQLCIEGLTIEEVLKLCE